MMMNDTRGVGEGRATGRCVSLEYVLSARTDVHANINGYLLVHRRIVLYTGVDARHELQVHPLINRKAI